MATCWKQPSSPLAQPWSQLTGLRFEIQDQLTNHQQQMRRLRAKATRPWEKTQWPQPVVQPLGAATKHQTMSSALAPQQDGSEVLAHWLDSECRAIPAGVEVSKALARAVEASPKLVNQKEKLVQLRDEAKPRQLALLVDAELEEALRCVRLAGQALFG